MTTRVQGQQIASPHAGVTTTGPHTIANTLADFTPGNVVRVKLVHYSSSPTDIVSAVTVNGASATRLGQVVQSPNTVNQAEIWEAVVPGGTPAHDVEVTYSGAGTPDGHYTSGSLTELSGSGAVRGSPVTASGNTNAPTASTDASTDAADEVEAIYVFADGGAPTNTNPSPGWTVDFDIAAGGFEYGASVWRGSNAGGSNPVTWGIGAAAQWGILVLSIAPAASGGPTISAQPSNAHVAAGATATFSVTASATGGGTLSYQWKLNGTNVSTGSGGTTASYTTAALGVADDAGSYTCVVTETGGSNDGSVTSSAAVVRVGVIFVAASTAVYSASGGSSVSPTYPAGLAAGDELVMLIGQKPSSANGGTATTPSSPWALDGSRTGANDGDTGGYTTTLGADTGNCNIFAYSKTCDGTETGSLAVTVGTNNVCWALMLLFRGPAGATWSVAATTGKDTSAGNVSITGAADPGVAAGDHVVCAMVIPTDVTTPAQFSAEAITQTGVTFGTPVEIEEPDSGTGNDIGGLVFRATVTAGPSSAAPTFTATAGGTTTNVRGPGVFVRVRASSSGPVNTPMSISATVTQTPSRVRALARAVASVTLTQSPSRLRAVGKSGSATVTLATGSAPVTTGIGQSLSGTVTQTPARVRAVGLSRSATIVAALIRLLALAKVAISGTVTQAPGAARSVGRPLALVTVTQAPSRLRAVGKPVTTTVTQAPAVARAMALVLSVVVAQTLTRVRAVGRVLTSPVAQVPSAGVVQSGGGAYFVNLSATVTQTMTVARALALAIATGQVLAPSRLRAIALVPRSATVTQVPSAAKGQGYFKSLSATVTQAAARLLGVGVARSATAAQTTALQRALARLLPATVIQAPSQLRALALVPRSVTVAQSPTMAKGQANFMSLAATVAQVPARALGVGITRAVSAVQAFVVTRALSFALSTSVTQAPSRSRAFTRAIAAIVAQAPTERHGQIYFLALSAGVTQIPSFQLEQHTGDALATMPLPRRDIVFFQTRTQTIKFRTQK